MQSLKIILFCHSLHGERILDPDYPEEHPLGGSETAVVYLAREFRAMGHEVRIEVDHEAIGKPPCDECDVFISSRSWNFFQENRQPGKLNYLYCHDDVDQPFVALFANPEVSGPIFDRMNAAVMVSHYQMNRWIQELNLPPEKAFVCPNGIPWERFDVKENSLEGRASKAYYASAPFRGLDRLIDHWEVVRKLVPEAEVTVCSSLTSYGGEDAEWIERLKQKAAGIEGIHWRGGVGQSELREIAKECRVLAYPCTFSETCCITAMEAMASGAVVASTSCGALPETAWRNPLLPNVDGWELQWVFEVARLFVDDAYYLMHARRNLDMAKQFSWKQVARHWSNRIRLDFAAL